MIQILFEKGKSKTDIAVKSITVMILQSFCMQEFTPRGLISGVSGERRIMLTGKTETRNVCCRVSGL